MGSVPFSGQSNIAMLDKRPAGPPWTLVDVVESTSRYINYFLKLNVQHWQRSTCCSMIRRAPSPLLHRVLKCLNSCCAHAGRRWPIDCQLWLRQTPCAIKSSLPGRTTWSAPCERWALAAKLLHSTAIQITGAQELSPGSKWQLGHQPAPTFTSCVLLGWHPTSCLTAASSHLRLLPKLRHAP